MNGFATILALEVISTSGKRNCPTAAWTLNRFKHYSPTTGRLNDRSKVDYDVSYCRANLGVVNFRKLLKDLFRGFTYLMLEPQGNHGKVRSFLTK